MFDGSFRESADKVTEPIGRALHRVGISPDVITLIGVGMAGACATAIATGHFFTAAVLLALTGLPDALDGAVAKASGRTGPRGAYFDSVSDRLSDGLLFGGAAWYFAGAPEPQFSGFDTARMAVLPFALYLAASLVSYQRAKAESLGFDAKGGLMERAERFIALGFGLVFSPLFTLVLWSMLALTLITVGTRFVKVWKQASKVSPVPPSRRARPASTERSERLRARRAPHVEGTGDFRTRARERMTEFRQR